LTVHAKTERDRLESAGEVFHERTRQFFLELARRDPERYLVLDARASRNEIAAQVTARVAPLLSPARHR
jgi:dTMP kinase